MATKMKVTYVDEREVEIVVSPRAQVETEEHFGGITEANSVRVGYYLAWASLHRAGKESADFNTWLDLVADIEEVAAPEPRPTQPAQPSGSSSD